MWGLIGGLLNLKILMLLMNEYKTDAVPRIYDLGKLLKPNKVVAIFGPRRSGKTTLVKEYVGDNELIVIDEAHLIPNIGINLKIMVDNIPDIHIIITGSSSFDLANQIGEPLVGRKFTWNRQKNCL